MNNRNLPPLPPMVLSARAQTGLIALRLFLGAHLIQRLLDDTIEFTVLTRWQSMESIRGFAGEAVEQAKVEAGAAAALIDFDDTVQHYDVIEEVSLIPVTPA